MTGYKLSATASRQVIDLYRQFKGETKGVRPDPRAGEYVDDPEVYFAKTPPGGIPARNGMQLGNALCQIYRGKLIEGSEPRRDFQAIVDHDGTTPVKKYVHNLNEDSEIAGDIYVAIWRHKDGTWFTLGSSEDDIFAFELKDQVDTLDDFPATAYVIDDYGTRTGEEIEVWAEEILTGLYGPAAGESTSSGGEYHGFRGWALRVSTSGAEYGMILNMQRFALFIEFENPGFSATGEYPCREQVDPTNHWHGEDPTEYADWEVWVDAAHYENCECLPYQAKGIAVLDERASEYPQLIYRVVEMDTMLRVAGAACESENPCAGGSPTGTLLFGDGLSVTSPECEESVPCPKLVKLIPDLVTGSGCINVTQEDCKYKVESNLSIIGGNGIQVQSSSGSCAYLISLAGGPSEPTTTIRYVCDIECIQGSGGWELQVKYGWLEVPTAIIASLVQECGSSGSSGGGPPPDEDSITFIDIDCDGTADDAMVAHYSFRIDSVPSGGHRCIITASGNMGSGPVETGRWDFVLGQVYWGALNEGWAAAQPGEQMTISAQWIDDEGEPVGSPIVWSPTCPT